MAYAPFRTKHVSTTRKFKVPAKQPHKQHSHKAKKPHTHTSTHKNTHTNKQTNRKTPAHLHTAKPKLNLFHFIYDKFTVPMLHPAIGPGSLYLTLSCYLATYLFIDYRPIYLSIYLFTSNNFYSLKPTSQQDPHPLSQCASWTFMEHVFPSKRINSESEAALEQAKRWLQNNSVISMLSKQLLSWSHPHREVYSEIYSETLSDRKVFILFLFPLFVNMMFILLFVLSYMVFMCSLLCLTCFVSCS